MVAMQKYISATAAMIHLSHPPSRPSLSLSLSISRLTLLFSPGRRLHSPKYADSVISHARQASWNTSLTNVFSYTAYLRTCPVNRYTWAILPLPRPSTGVWGAIGLRPGELAPRLKCCTLLCTDGVGSAMSGVTDALKGDSVLPCICSCCSCRCCRRWGVVVPALVGVASGCRPCCRWYCCCGVRCDTIEGTWDGVESAAMVVLDAGWERNAGVVGPRAAASGGEAAMLAGTRRERVMEYCCVSDCSRCARTSRRSRSILVVVVVCRQTAGE